MPGVRTVLAKWREQSFRRNKEERMDCNVKRRKERVIICVDIKRHRIRKVKIVRYRRRINKEEYK